MGSLYKKPIVITDRKTGREDQNEIQEMVGPVP